MPSFLIAAASAFIILALARFRWALFVLLALLPSYLWRFHVASIPGTFLEVMILSVVTVWLFTVLPTIPARSTLTAIRTYWPISAGIFLLIISGAIAIFIAPEIRAAAGLWKAYILETTALFAVLITTLTRRDISRIITAFSITALITGSYAIYQKFTGFGIPNPYWAAEETRRVTSVWGFPNAIGLFLAPLIPLFLSRVKNGSLQTLYWLFVSAISVLAILYAQSTGAMTALAVGAFFIAFLHKKTRFASLVIFGVSLFALLTIPAFSLLRSEILLQDYSGTLRRDMWGEAAQLVSEHPLLGTGLAGYPYAIARYRIDKWIEIYQYPHTILLNTWVELGLAGVLAFVCLLYGSIRPLFKKPYDRLSYALLASWAILLIHGLVDVPYFKNDLAVLFLTLAAISILKIRRKSATINANS